MARKKIKKPTCFALGLAGSILGLAGGALMFFGLGPAQLLQTASFVLLGAMLLFLCVVESGEAAKKQRIKLFLLFLMLFLAYLRLPPLNLLQAAVVPYVYSSYRSKKGGVLLPALVLCELAFAATETLAITHMLGSHELAAFGAALLLVSLVRGAALLVLFRSARLQADG